MERGIKGNTAYKRLVEDLISGEMNLSLIDIAVMEWIRQREVLPEGVKNLLCVPGGGGLVRGLFHQIKQTIGQMELAYRRGILEGKDYKSKVQ